MVARITIPKNIQKALNYNEQKVSKGTAQCIHAQNFLKSAQAMNFYEKLLRFTKLIELNHKAKTNTLHVSLNFDPSETLNKDKLIQIAQVYMKKIGFENQPYLIYQHSDAGHPHIHIVSTTIQKDGSRINTHNIGRNQSAIARKEIEKEFHLVKAEGRAKQLMLQPLDIKKAVYGKSETKKAITNVLHGIIPYYKFCSLPELNAVLRLYNVTADTGSPGGKIEKNKGLMYRILDEKGEKIGVPIKASAISGSPTLKRLEELFIKNENLKIPLQRQLKKSIDDVLLSPGSLKEFIEALRKHKIDVALRMNNSGYVYGITYIDHNGKSVFNGSDLGKTYSAAAVLKKINNGSINEDSKPEAPPMQQTKPINDDNSHNAGIEKSMAIELNKKEAVDMPVRDKDMLEQLINPDKVNNYLPYELRKKKKKKRRKKPKL